MSSCSLIAEWITALVAGITCGFGFFTFYKNRKQNRITLHMYLVHVQKKIERTSQEIPGLLADEKSELLLKNVLPEYAPYLDYSVPELSNAEKYLEICRESLKENDMVVVRNYILVARFYFNFIRKMLDLKDSSDEEKRKEFENMTVSKFKQDTISSLTPDACYLLNVDWRDSFEDVWKRLIDLNNKYWNEINKRILRKCNNSLAQSKEIL